VYNESSGFGIYGASKTDEEVSMNEDFQQLDYHELEQSVRKDDLVFIDEILMADLGRSWECIGNNAAHTLRSSDVWSSRPEDMRDSPLGKSLLMIAAYAHSVRGMAFREDVEQAMKLVYRQLYGDTFSAGYILPKQFNDTPLGQLFDEAESKEHDFEELMTPKEACRFVGVTRQTLHARGEKGKLQRFYRGGRYLYVRSELEKWKKQHEQRRNRSKS
jgi:excisionase family DNA binding protein